MRGVALNVVGRQVTALREQRGWSQEILAQKLQLLGWDISRSSLGKLEIGLRRVPDCELLFVAKALGVEVGDLFPSKVEYKVLGPSFRSSTRGNRSKD